MNMPSLTQLDVSLADRSYPIYIANGALTNVDRFFALDRRVLIVTDDGVPSAYAQTVAARCAAPTVITVKSGEESKSFASLETLCRTMLAKGFTRGDCVVAVGGGIVGDLSGFAASVYMRGIDFYNIPTTLLAQVDSSIGGKVAVNLDGIKNAVGAFYQPRAVLIDPAVLETLPYRQIAAGLAESVKMATTFDRELFALLEEENVRERLTEVITASLKIKKAVVEQDEKESGLRRVLNFGHTLGHGIESVFGFAEDAAQTRENGGLYHGECVALGMLPMCADTVRARLLTVLRKLSLPTDVRADAARIAQAAMHDKKAGDGFVNAVFVDEIGSYRIEKTSFSALEARFREVFA